MRDTNLAVRAFAEARRYPVKRLEDGELVILARRHRKRRGWWALEPHADGPLWAFYLDVGRAPGNLLRGLPVVPGIEDRSSDVEVYFRVPEAAGEALMATGPAWCRVTPRRTVSPEVAAAGAARLQKARTPS